VKGIVRRVDIKDVLSEQYFISGGFARLMMILTVAYLTIQNILSERHILINWRVV
jgi:hypothetical protein